MRNLSKRWVTFENIQKEILYGYQDTNIYPPTQVIATTNQIIEAFRNVLQVHNYIYEKMSEAGYTCGIGIEALEHARPANAESEIDIEAAQRPGSNLLNRINFEQSLEPY